MIATAVPTRRREVLAIDMGTVLRLPWPFVNLSTKLIDDSALTVRQLNAALSIVAIHAGRHGNS